MDYFVYTYFYVIIYKIWKQWKPCPHFYLLLWWKIGFHYLKSTHLSWFGSHFLSRTLVLPFSSHWSWTVHFSFSTGSFTPTYTILLHFLTLRLPMLPSYFPYHCLHFFISLSHSKGLLFLPLPPDAVSKVTKACFPAGHCHGYLLSFSYSIPRQQSKLLSWLSISFWGDAFLSFYACGSPLSPDCLLLLRLLVNNFINSSFSVTPLRKFKCTRSWSFLCKILLWVGVSRYSN